MQSPLVVRSLTADEQATLEAELRPSQGFTVRRCQMPLASAAEQSTMTIARTSRCNDQTVHTAIHDFYWRGLAALGPTAALRKIEQVSERYNQAVSSSEEYPQCPNHPFAS